MTAFFNIVGITSAYSDTNPADPDIWLVKIHTPTAVTFGKNGSTSTTANNNGTGVRLDGSSNISPGQGKRVTVAIDPLSRSGTSPRTPGGCSRGAGTDPRREFVEDDPVAGDAPGPRLTAAGPALSESHCQRTRIPVCHSRSTSASPLIWAPLPAASIRFHSSR